MRKVELLPTWDCEAGYDPESMLAKWSIDGNIKSEKQI